MTFEYDQDYFSKHFASNFYLWYLEIIRNRFIKRRIEKYINSGNFLEIGFGNDNLFKLFIKNFNVCGVDISEFAVNNMRKKYNLNNFKVCNIAKEKIPFDDKFNVICAINTVEHLENFEFGLTNIFNSLTIDGIFAVYLPTQSNFISRLQYKFLYDVPEHVYRPSIHQLTRTLNTIGYKKLEEYAASIFPFKIGNLLMLNSLNLYFGVFKK